MEEIQEMCIQTPGREDPLEEEMTTHSSILTWKTPGQRHLEGYIAEGFFTVWAIREAHKCIWIMLMYDI